MRFPFALLCLTILTPALGEEITVPSREAKLQVDGRLLPTEWADAKSVPLADGVFLQVQTSGENVLIGVRAAVAWASYVDLFLEDGSGKIWNLHGSLQRGERQLSGANWDDRNPPTAWGGGADWFVNVQRWKPGRKADAAVTRESFEPYDGHEFLISRGRFPGAQWRLRVEVRDFGGERADVVYPKDSQRHAPATWTLLRFGAEYRA